MLLTLLKKLDFNLKCCNFIKLSFLIFTILFGYSNANAQLVSNNYNFSESFGNAYTYLPATPTVVDPTCSGVVATGSTFTSIASLTAATLPFSFHYNGTSYNKVMISDNGFIIIGDANLPSAATTNPTLSSNAYSGAISGYGTNLAGTVSTSEVKYDVIGTAPNRVFVVQYKDLVRRGATNFPGIVNMQIRLSEGTNLIEVVFDNAFASVSSTQIIGQAGLRGASNTDFNTRRNATNAIYPTTDATTLNTEGLKTYGQASGVAVNGYKAGTKFVWTPCFAPYSVTAVMQADNSTLNINWTLPSYIPTGGIDWEVRTSGGPGTGSSGLFASGNTTSSSVTVPGLSIGITYYIYYKANCRTTWLPTNVAPSTISVLPTCNVVTALPYVQDFESVTAPAMPVGTITTSIPVCNAVQAVTGSAFGSRNSSSTAYYGFTSKNLITQGALAMDTWYFTQKITLAPGSYKLSYKYGGSREQAFFVQKMRVAYGLNQAATAAGMTGGILLADHNNIKESPLTNSVTFTVSTAGDYCIGFQGYADASQGFLQLDDIKLEVATCQVPTALASGQLTSNSAIISWTAPVSAPSSGYQYYYSTSNVSPLSTSIPSGTTSGGVTLATLTGLNASTAYYFWVRSNCGNGDVSAWSALGTFTTLSPYVASCTPNGLAFSQDPKGITNVTMGSINNTTGIEANNYGNYSNLTTNVSQGTTVPVSITYKTGYTYDTTIFVDWNNNGSFLDSGEVVYTGVSTSSNPTTLSASFLVPITATFGPHLVRIGGQDYGPVTDPCRAGSYQVFEDYTIYVIAPPPALTISTSSDSICAGASTLTPLTVTSNQSDFQVYSWTPSTGISGSLTSGYTFNPTTTTTYVLKATQTSGSYASNTVSFTVTVNPLPTPIILTPTSVTMCSNDTPQVIASTGGIITGVLLIDEDFNGVTNTFTTVNNSTPLTVTTNNNPADAAWTLHPSPYAYGSTTFLSNDNSQFYLSNSDDQGSTGTTNTELISPSFSLAAPVTDAVLSFWHYYKGYVNGTASVEISINGGGAWTALPGNSWTTTSQGTSSSFVKVIVNLSAYVGNSNVKIRFKYTNAQYGWYWAIDNVKVTSSQSSEVTWSPITGLYTDSTGNVPYTGDPSAVVYAKPSATQTYIASTTSPEGCYTSTSIAVNVTPVNGGLASSNQIICLGPASDLTLSGYSGTITKWQRATNLAFTTPIDIPTSGSATLTSAQIGSINATMYYRAVVTNGSCTAFSNVVTIAFNSTTWSSGSWSNGLPNSGIAAVFDDDYNASTDSSLSGLVLNACSVYVSSGTVTFDSGYTLNVVNNVDSSGGVIIFENNASLVQTALVTNLSGYTNGGNIGNITFKRSTTPMKKLDYTYWSSPVSPQTLFNLSPNTPSDKYYYYNPLTDNWVSALSSSAMQAAKGYIIRAPQTFSTTVASVYNGQFSGVPNNGIITIPILNNSVDDSNLIGNPYPSALNADAFLNANKPANGGVVAGTIYLWTHNTGIANNTYNTNDYALYNLTGGVGTAAINSGVNNTVPSGKIAAGQGFFVESTGSGTATFTNAMRVDGNNSNFYKNGSQNNSVSSIEKNRVWLELVNGQGAFKQTMVGYITNATNSFDLGYDGRIMDGGNQVSLYSVLGSNLLGIQGRALPFDVNDVVPLGYATSSAGSYTIRLSSFDGLFNNQNVYIEDTLLNVVHDLKLSEYTFATNSGTFNTRFVLRFATTTLGNNETLFDDNSVIVYKDNQNIVVNTSNKLIKDITVFDVGGRQIFEKKNIESAQFEIKNLNSAKQVLLIAITSMDNKKITKKIIF